MGISRGWVLMSPILRTWDTTGCGWQAGRTHPTGILSCFYCNQWVVWNSVVSFHTVRLLQCDCDNSPKEHISCDENIAVAIAITPCEQPFTHAVLSRTRWVHPQYQQHASFLCAILSVRMSAASGLLLMLLMFMMMMTKNFSLFRFAMKNPGSDRFNSLQCHFHLNFYVNFIPFI